jgi:hypothetical protein
MCDQIHPYLDNNFSGYDVINSNSPEYFDLLYNARDINKINDINKIKKQEMSIFKKLNILSDSNKNDYTESDNLDLFSKEGVRKINERAYIKNNIEEYFVNDGQTLLKEIYKQDKIKKNKNTYKDLNDLVNETFIAEFYNNPMLLRIFIMLLFIVVMIQLAEIRSQKLLIKHFMMLNTKSF